MYQDYRQHEPRTPAEDHAPQYQADENAAVCLLQYMEKDQLNEYLNTPDKVDTHIADLEQVKKLHRDRENIIVKNKSLAEFNVSQQPAFDNLKQQVAKSYEEVNSLKMALGKDIARLDSLPGSQSHDTLLAIFQTEAATADDNSEELAEEFCDGKVDIDTFISDYVQKRTDSYVKRAKLEKVGDLFRHGTTSTSSAPYPSSSSSYTPKPAAPAFSGAGYGSGSTPYPAAPYAGMPMPSYYQR